MASPTPAPPPPAGPRALAPGDTYEGFQLLELLGTGTFAWVFAARHPAYEHDVALKVSREPVISEETALRALREIRILGSLANPHVVHVYDHGLGSDERWYMVMERLQGRPLSAHHEFDKQLPPKEAVRIVHQAGLGLDEAHRGGVVHRDIKPDNLWIMPDGTVKVLDFGLARAWDSGSTMGMNATAANMLVGTPHYAQPEQVHSGRLTPASDVYSLGIVLYELLVGRTPFFADERCSQVRERLREQPLGWLVAHVRQPIVPIDHYPEGARLPTALVEIVHRCLAKDPNERFQTAGALANALAWILHGELGGTAASILHVAFPSGARRTHILLPGVYRIGLGAGCDIRIADTDMDVLFAILEWSGSPHEAELRPMVTDGSLRINGHLLDYRVRLVPGTKIQMGPLRLELTYPNQQ